MGSPLYYGTGFTATEWSYLPTPLQDLRAEFYERAVPSLQWLDYMRENHLSPALVEAHAGVLGLCPVEFLPGRRFDFSDEGVLSAVIEVLDEDGETTVDLLAWAVNQPAAFASALGCARGLGPWQARNRATYFNGRPLQLWRTPLSWLKAGCSGAVVVEPQSAISWLASAPGLIAGEDLAHAREIAHLLHPYVDPSRIVAPLAEAA